jgi:uncharacterized protein
VKSPGQDPGQVGVGKTSGSKPFEDASLTYQELSKPGVQLVTSPLIVEEYRAIAGRPKFHRFGFPPLWLEFLIEESMYLSDPVRWPHAGSDPKDMPFLALAHSAGAWLVTGNLRHFPQEIRDGVTVLSPTDYLAHLMKDTKPRL